MNPFQKNKKMFNLHKKIRMKTKLTLTLLVAISWHFSSAQWQQLHPRLLPWTANGLSAPGENKVFAIAGSTVVISENLGASWETVFVTDQYTFFTQLSFANPMQGSATSYEWRVYVTSDGGHTWKKSS